MWEMVAVQGRREGIQSKQLGGSCSSPMLFGLGHCINNWELNLIILSFHGTPFCNHQQPVWKDSLQEVRYLLYWTEDSVPGVILFWLILCCLPDLVCRSFSVPSFQEGCKEVYSLEEHNVAVHIPCARSICCIPACYSQFPWLTGWTCCVSFNIWRKQLLKM